MSRIAITGASGFIGLEWAASAKSCGHEVVRLMQVRARRCCSIVAIGRAAPPECEDVDVLVHLASVVLVATGSIAEAAERDILGSRLLLDGVRQLRKGGSHIRFIFISSQSAQAEAANVYGRSKWKIETMLEHKDRDHRPSWLVYGDRAASVFALIERLARLPVVPVITARANIQPIHVRELSECIAQIAEIEQPVRLFKLGAIKPMTLKDVIYATARRAGRKPPIAVPLPGGLVRLAAQALDRLLNATPSLTERMDGLIALQPMNTETSLRTLGSSGRSTRASPRSDPSLMLCCCLRLA